MSSTPGSFYPVSEAEGQRPPTVSQTDYLGQQAPATEPHLQGRYLSQAQATHQGLMSPLSISDLDPALYTYAQAPSPDNEVDIQAVAHNTAGSTLQPHQGYTELPVGMFNYHGQRRTDQESFSRWQASLMPADTLETHDFVPATYPPDDTQPTTTAATPAPSRQSSNERFDERFVFQQAYYQGSEEPSTDAASSTWRDDRVAGFLPIQPVSHSCPNCPNSFNSTAELKQHKKHCEANIACLLQFAGCEDRFAAANEWKRHMKAQHFVTESYLCTLGDCARDTSRPLLPSPLPWRHVREQIPQYGCRFARKDSHKDHIRNSHWNLLPEVRQKPRKLTAAQEKYLLSLERTPNPVESPIPAVMHCYAPGCNESFQAPGRDKAHGDESSAAPEQVENQSSGSAAAPNRSRAYCDEFLNHMGATHLHGNAPVPDRDADGRGVWLFDYGFANGFLEARTGGKVVTREPLGKSNNKRRAGRRHHRAALSTVAP